MGLPPFSTIREEPCLLCLLIYELIAANHQAVALRNLLVRRFRREGSLGAEINERNCRHSKLARRAS